MYARVAKEEAIAAWDAEKTVKYAGI